MRLKSASGFSKNDRRLKEIGIYRRQFIRNCREYDASALTPCKASDQVCIDKIANDVYQLFMEGVPALGIEPHEPMHHALIEGDLSILKYKFVNTTFIGLNKCKISNVKLDEGALKVHVELSCPKIEMKAHYEIGGRLIILPIEGEGECYVVTGEYKLVADFEVKIAAGGDGSRYMSVRSYKLKPTAVGPIVFDFMNLFNGQKDLSDTVHKFANENWKEVADFVQEPVWYAHAKKLVSTANKFLKAVPLDEMSI